MTKKRSRSNIGRRTRHTRDVRFKRQSRTADQRSQDNENARQYMAILRTQESEEQRNQRLKADLLRKKQKRDHILNRNRQLNQRMQLQRALKRSSSDIHTCKHDLETESTSHSNITIKPDKECEFKIENETEEMCMWDPKISSITVEIKMSSDTE